MSVMVNTLFLKYISCCSTSSLGNMPPATTHLKIFRPGQPYRLSACHLSMQHNHGITRTVLSVNKNWCPNLHTINHVHQAYQNTIEAQCRGSEIPVPQNFVVAPLVIL